MSIPHAAEGDNADIDAAVRAARRAFESGPWPALTASERGKMVWRIGDLISKYTDELGELESLDNGKPMAVARASSSAGLALVPSVPSASRIMIWYAAVRRRCC